jgi:recombination protein RecR
MTKPLAEPVQSLVDQLSRLPGVGPKSAQRIALHLLEVPQEDAERLAQAIRDARQRTRLCLRCWNFSDGELCDFCKDPARDASVVCVVEEPRDVLAIERGGGYHGRYHVLHGALSPIDGIGPDQLRIKELLARVQPEDIKEVIVATNPTSEGDTTALYLAKILGPLGVRVTQLARGVPVGGEIEYLDSMTIDKAMQARREITSTS